MKKYMYKILMALVAVVASGLDATAQDVEILDDRALQFLDPGAQIDLLGEGFAWTEGPLWVEDGSYLLFSDIPNNIIHKWQPGAGVTEYLTPSGSTGYYDDGSTQGSNGLLLDPSGQLILLQQGDRRVARMDADLESPKAEFVTIIDRFNGARFNSPNDGVYASDGSLYFTDPPYGLDNTFDNASRELEYQGVFRLSPSGDVILVDDSVAAPNGIALSPDEKTLYVASSDDELPVWMAYDIGESQQVLKSRVFFDATEAAAARPGKPDGMAVHSSGAIFATGPGGVWLFAADGTPLARIYTGRLTANCTLSADEQTLFMTAHETLLKLELRKAEY